jgi:hypothetical protein
MSRFWAWSAYVPFSLAVSLVFFGHCDGVVVLIALLFSTIPVHLALNWLESRYLSPTGLPGNFFQSNYPQSKLVQFLIGGCLGGIFYTLIIEFRTSATVEDKVGHFFSDMIAPWMFGSFASQIPFVAISSLLAAVTFINCVTPVKPESAGIAKGSLLILLILSLFTVWVSSSELNTAGEMAGFAVESFLKKLIGLPIDLGISVVWFMGLVAAFAEIGREQRRFKSPAVTGRAFPPVWVKLVFPAVGWGCLLLAMLIGIIRQ